MARARRTGKALLLASALLSLGSVLVADPQNPKSAGRTELRAQERERLLAIGKKLFVERCARCHDERGDKALKSGPPLSERKLSDEEIARVVSGRFRDASDEQKHAAALYIRSFVKKK